MDDIVEGLIRVIDHPPTGKSEEPPCRIYNIGNSKSEPLMKVIECLENALGKEAKKKFLPQQQGDVYATTADVSELEQDFGFKPNTTIEVGVQKFVSWYLSYFKS